MTWNWQQPDWPDFSWRAQRLTHAEQRFLLGGGVLFGMTDHLDETLKGQLTIEAISEEAVTSSEIEGEILNRDSVQSSIRRQLGLGGDARRVKPAEQGMAEMMVDLYRRVRDPLDHATLFAWHAMLMRRHARYRPAVEAGKTPRVEITAAGEIVESE